MKPESFWTDERTDELKSRWAKGETGSEIFRAMAAPSRNAVVGKVYRLGLDGRVAIAAKNSNNNRNKRRRQYRTVHYADGKVFIVEGEQGMLEEKPPIFKKPVKFFDLKDHHCRWPGAGDMPDLLFCGAAVADGYSYCPAHCRIAFNGAPQVKAPRR
jgi:GcrA cell cycle regulator